MSRVFDRLVRSLAAQGAQPREELDTRRVRICPRCREDWMRCEHSGHVLMAPPPTERGWLVKSQEKVLA
jgi:hypothetical protein